MNPRLLLVDDEEMYLEYLSKRLINRGYQVTKCLTGEEALQHISRSAFDVVILDVLLPGMDGIETLREINKRSPFDRGYYAHRPCVTGIRSGRHETRSL